MNPQSQPMTAVVCCCCMQTLMSVSARIFCFCPHNNPLSALGSLVGFRQRSSWQAAVLVVVAKIIFESFATAVH